MKSEEQIKNLLDENRRINDLVKQKFSTLTFDELNFRPEKYAWSVAECFDHLIVTNNQYITLIEEGLNNSSSDENSNTEFKSTFAGRFLLNSLDPDNRKKLKSPRLFRPEIKVYTKEVIKAFIDQNNVIYSLICKSRDLDAVNIKIHSPVTKLLRFNLLECFQIMNVHERRHINQAHRILGK
jgi:hypothetical protein